ncbi:Piwi-domain-containing protein [Neoconidiobolus thromboides FSU 785]|nr:Piwi-domain-containing protein [Neoconidiobolus thromboides FSU 785]
MFDLVSKTSQESEFFCIRPGHGRVGTRLKVRSNFFEIKSFTRNTVFHYDLSFSVDAPPKLVKKLYDELLRSYGPSHFGKKPIFDGRRNLFSAEPLTFGDSTSMEVRYLIDMIILPEDNKNKTRAPQPFTVFIKKVRIVKMEELHEYLKGNTPLTPNCLVAVMALELAFRYKPSTMFTTVGRSIFTPENSRAIYGGLEVWQGYFQSCKPSIRKMLLNIDTTATCFYQPISLVDFIVKLLDRRDPRDFQYGIQERDMQKITKALIGLAITSTHRDAKRPFKIQGISQYAADNDYFKEAESGNEISVAQYFQNKYRLRLHFPFFPCIIVSKKGNKLPLEVCKIMPGQRYMKKLNERQTSDMIKLTCQRPNERANKINESMKILKHDQNEFLDDFKISLSNEMINLDARVLPGPRINYHPHSNENPTLTPGNGSWNMRGLKVVQGAQLISWSVVAFVNPYEVSERDIQRFVREFVSTCQDTGMDIPSKHPPPIGYVNPQGNIENSLRERWLLTGNTYQMEPQLILFILPNTGTPLYAEVKRVCDTVIGVSSQCVQLNYVKKCNRQYCANVCLKVNVKLGGVNNYLSPEDVPFVSSVPTIIVGADVTHPGPGDGARPSIATLVGSVDAKVARYCASVRVQAGRSEIIADLAGMFVEILRNFYKQCGQKPRRILFYRDGISDGQFASVLKSELEAIRTACSRLEAGYLPAITFVVVKKRHHARFFPINSRDADRSGNLHPGTVVDQGVTHPKEFDFFLQSHAGLIGTSRPAHYYVLHDENRFTSDGLQMLTNNLCYLFSRCTKSVSIVPPIYYAHLVAARARFHSRSGAWSDIESEASQKGDISSYGNVKKNISNQMYFV